MTADILDVDVGERVPHHVAVASAVAALLTADVRTLVVSPQADPAAATDQVLAALADDRTIAGVLSAAADPDALCWRVAGSADKPVVLVPPGSRPPRPFISRALLPLDGTEESAKAVETITRLLAQGGVDMIAVHVFEPATVPMFWDQRAHAHQAWSEEFLSRSGTPPGTRLDLCAGLPGEQVVRTAHTEDVDLVALGWSRHMGAGHAKTVREAVLEASVPVLLVPIVGSG
jgi:hypothetical protein